MEKLTRFLRLHLLRFIVTQQEPTSAHNRVHPYSTVYKMNSSLVSRTHLIVWLSLHYTKTRDVNAEGKAQLEVVFCNSGPASPF